MPQIFRIGSYIVYFWSNENNPLEPIHVHIAEEKWYSIVIDALEELMEESYKTRKEYHI